MPFFEWLRSNSEEYLLEASQRDMAARYGIAAPADTGSFFWRRIFTPVYRLLPWRLRRSIMGAMPGSHRRWMRRAPP
ncbi:MAG: hypothetical protein ACRDGK_07830 [Actinomycetota bacterium]